MNASFPVTSGWTFLSNHGRVLLCMAEDPDIRLRDLAGILGLTERRTHTIVRDLEEAGYVAKQRKGRRNHYVLRNHLPIPEDPAGTRPIGAVLEVLTSSNAGP
jgi:N-glycosylase/DNA lyase